MNLFFQIKAFLVYWFKAATPNAIHSPFIFEITTSVIHDKRFYYSFDEIEQLRQLLISKSTPVPIIEYGAGSNTNTNKTRAMADLLQKVAIPIKYGQVLFRLVNHLQPKTIVELGTSLGISTAYMTKAATQATCLTFEGNPHCAAIARSNFELLKLPNIQILEGNFNNTFFPVIQQLESVDFAFVDGNHQFQPTLDYFYALKEKRNTASVFIFHDIHWSKGMQNAWETIKKDADVTLTIDLFNMGMVFFRTGVPKQDFIIRY